MCGRLLFFPNFILDASLNQYFSKLTHYPPVFQLGFGLFSSAASLFLIQPLEVARCRLAADKTTGRNKKYKGIIDVLNKVGRVDGFESIYRAFAISFGGMLVYRFSYDFLLAIKEVFLAEASDLT